MKVEKTQRGFERIDFTDSYRAECSLQVSSCVDPHIWFGCNENAPNHHVTNEPMSPRMHLTREQAIELVRHLLSWIETGSFRAETDQSLPLVGTVNAERVEFVDEQHEWPAIPETLASKVVKEIMAETPKPEVSE